MHDRWLTGDYASLYLEELLRQSVLACGRTHPNPTVAALCFDSDNPDRWASGATEPPGKRHAEIVALDAFRASFGGDPDSLLVTLEPCSKAGRTPPCVNRILATPGLRNIYIGGLDPSLSAEGVKQLKNGGRRVFVADAGTLRGLAGRRDLSSFLSGLGRLYGLFPGSFVHRLMHGRPRLVLKAASDETGLMGDKHSRLLISGSSALAAGQLLRRTMDAVIVGPGTILTDEPGLDWRPAGAEPGSHGDPWPAESQVPDASPRHEGSPVHGEEAGPAGSRDPGDARKAGSSLHTPSHERPVHHLRAPDPFLESLLHYGQTEAMQLPEFEHQPVRIFLMPYSEKEKRNQLEDFKNRQWQRSQKGGPDPVFWTLAHKQHPGDLPSLKDPLFVSELIQNLCTLGLNTVLVEGGAGLHRSLRTVLWPDDRFYWFRSRQKLDTSRIARPVHLPDFLMQLPELQRMDLQEDELIAFAGRA